MESVFLPLAFMVLCRIANQRYDAVLVWQRSGSLLGAACAGYASELNMSAEAFSSLAHFSDVC